MATHRAEALNEREQGVRDSEIRWVRKGPESKRRRKASLSQMLWGLDWRERLPLTVTEDGVSLHASTFEESMPFVQAHYAEIFHHDAQSLFASAPSSPHKEHFYRVAGDFFELRDGEETVGLVVGNPVDWSTYYIRSVAVLPNRQGRGIASRCLEVLIGELERAGLERVEIETLPSNAVMLGVLTALSFNVTGTVLTERWGALIRLTRFLSVPCGDIFTRAFCGGAAFPLRSRSAV